MGKDVVCPATMCPYMGAEDGSVWTGEKEDECETACGWWDDYGDSDGGCIAGRDLTGMALDRAGGEVPDGEVPPCQWEDRCQWQQKAGDGVPCPPRLLMMAGHSPTEALF